MKKIKFLPFLLLLSLCGTAPAFYTDSFVTGDTNNIHLEVSFEWLRNDVGGQLSGTWEGGNYIFGQHVRVGTLPIPGDPNGAYMVEVRPYFLMRTIWNDGYDPGGSETGCRALTGPMMAILTLATSPLTPFTGRYSTAMIIRTRGPTTAGTTCSIPTTASRGSTPLGLIWPLGAERIDDLGIFAGSLQRAGHRINPGDVWLGFGHAGRRENASQFPA